MTTTATTACFLAVPGTGTHLELTSGGGHAAPRRIRSPCSSSTSATRRRSRGRRPARGSGRPANPYWAEHGLTFEDPDGFRVVLVPERWEG